MRQAGIIAAPGIVALEKMIDRLKEDHDNALFLAEKLSRMPAIKINLESVQTNIVSFKIEPFTTPDSVFLQKLEKNGVLALVQAKNTIRFVTHRGIEREDAEKTVAVVESILKSH